MIWLLRPVRCRAVSHSPAEIRPRVRSMPGCCCAQLRTGAQERQRGGRFWKVSKVAPVEPFDGPRIVGIGEQSSPYQFRAQPHSRRPGAQATSCAVARGCRWRRGSGCGVVEFKRQIAPDRESRRITFATITNLHHKKTRARHSPGQWSRFVPLSYSRLRGEDSSSRHPQRDIATGNAIE